MKLSSRMALYIAGSVAIKGLTLCVLPYSLALLQPAQLGLYSLFNSFIAIISTVIAVGLRQVFWIEFFHKKPSDRRMMLNDIILIYVVVATPLLIALCMAVAFINKVVFVNDASPFMIYISLLSCFFVFFTELFYQVLVATKRIVYLLIVQLCGALVMVTGSVVFLNWNWGVTGLLGAQLCSALVVCVWAGQEYWKRNLVRMVCVQRVKSLFKQYITAGLPFISSVLAAFFITSSSRWLLVYYSNLHNVGIYSVVEMVGTLFQVIVLQPFQNTYLPFLFERFVTTSNIIHIEDENKQRMWRVVLLLGVTGLSGYILLRPLVYHLVPIAYHRAIMYAPLMFIGQLLLLGASFMLAYVQFCKKTYFIGGSLVACALVNALLCRIFIPQLQVVGALLALVGTYAFYFVISWMYNRSLVRIKPVVLLIHRH